MKKIEAKTLEEAYRIACETFDCSFSDLKYEIIQYPSKGLFGIFSRPAVIVADRLRTVPTHREERPSPPTETASETPEATVQESDRKTPAAVTVETDSSREEILDRFFEEGLGDEPGEAELQEEIENRLKALIETSCFRIDVIEVDVIDGTAYIFLDGEDAALIIGKEGYRYNALSYLLFNWIHGRYGLYIKLEVAQFLSSQQEMIRHTLRPVIEHVEREGWGRTRPLDGILVQIALEQLREAFPDKYVAIRRQRDGGRYILINEFNNRRQ